MVYRRRGRPTYYLKLPTRTGWIQRSTGTSDRATAKGIERMLVDLGPKGKRAWDLLDDVAADRLTLGELYDAWSTDDLAGLRARQVDVDLADHITGWQAWLADRVTRDTAAHYLAYLRTLIPADQHFWRSEFTGPAIARWLATRTSLPQKRAKSAKGSRRQPDPVPRPVSGGTKRRYLAAVLSFTAYLVELGILSGNPLRDVSAPPAAAPRCSFLELPDVQRVVEGAPEPFGAIYALAYGAGLEISAILALVESDIDSAARQVRGRGTKAWTRDRIARVADWAWPWVEAHLRGVLPGERVFRGVDRWQAAHVHRERLRALGLVGHRLHDARHHWAVRMARAGAPFELIARQLGHRDVAMVAKVYGRFKPDTEERDRWERVAGARDKEKWHRPASATGASAEKSDEVETVSGYDVSSRGGTRTRDPGIMRIVAAPTLA